MGIFVWMSSRHHFHMRRDNFPTSLIPMCSHIKAEVTVKHGKYVILEKWRSDHSKKWQHGSSVLISYCDVVEVFLQGLIVLPHSLPCFSTHSFLHVWVLCIHHGGSKWITNSVHEYHCDNTYKDQTPLLTLISYWMTSTQSFHY